MAFFRADMIVYNELAREQIKRIAEAFQPHQKDK